MNDIEVLEYCGDNGKRWAEMFCRIVNKIIRKEHNLEDFDLDEGWIAGWFANAIEHSSDVRRWGNESGRVYEWMQERNLKWPLDPESKMLFDLTWNHNDDNLTR